MMKRRGDLSAMPSIGGATVGMVMSLGLLLVSASGQEGKTLTRVPPTSPGKALQTFSSGAGFDLELLAAEPLVADPVVLKYDARGRGWVCEMADYPYTDPRLDLPWKEQPSPPGGRVRILFDDDQDGRFDRSTVFADNLSWPTGLAFWQGGVFVAATPDLWYLKDTDGDGRADVRRKIFTGFRKYNVQAVMNNLAWGLDHWIYVAGGSNGGTIRHVEHPERPAVRLGRNDFRFHPRTLELEIIPGGARFGNAFDDWGNRFITNIRNPIRHAVLPGSLLRANRYLPVASALHDVAPAGDALRVYRTSPAEPWRVINAERLARAGSPKTPRSERTATGFVTSACGVTIYRGSAYPESYYGNAFVAEVAGNLVMRYELTPLGVTFQAAHWLGAGHREFLASTDNWFRPVNFVNAPDGTLHLVDMYRQTIEHPWSIPDDLKSRLDLRRGSDRGRIYRIVPPSDRRRPGRTSPVDLDRMTTPQLVQQLDHPDAWRRDTAHRLIFERAVGKSGEAAVGPLRHLVRTAANPRTRMLALWSLEGLERLTPNDLLAAADAAEPRLRRHVVRLASRHASEDRAWRAFIERGIEDSDRRVRFEAAIGLARLGKQAGVSPLGHLALSDGDDPWCQVAIASASLGREEEAIAAWLPLIEQHEKQVLPLIEKVVTMVAGRRDRERLGAVAVRIAQSDIVRRTLSPTKRNDTIASWWRIGTELRAARDASSDTRSWYRRLRTAAHDVAADAASAPLLRVEAIRFLSNWPTEPEIGATLRNCCGTEQPFDVQRAAIAALYPLPDVLAERLDQWTPALQQEAVGAMLRTMRGTRELLERIAEGHLPRTLVSLNRRAQLARSPDDTIRRLARKVFGDGPSPDRRAVIHRFRSALMLYGAVSRGRQIYRRECAACHRLGSEGKQVGPDLDTVGHRSAEDLLAQILDPDREVAPEYQRYAVLTRDGRVRSGIIREESPSSVTLVEAEGRRVVLLRSDIEALRAEPRSLMPVGFESKLTPQQMADLIALLRSGGE